MQETGEINSPVSENLRVLLVASTAVHTFTSSLETARFTSWSAFTFPIISWNIANVRLAVCACNISVIRYLIVLRYLSAACH